MRRRTLDALLTTGGYPKANHGGSSPGNDVVAFPTANPTMLTSSTTDNPEPSAIVTSPTSKNPITPSPPVVATADRN